MIEALSLLRKYKTRRSANTLAQAVREAAKLAPGLSRPERQILAIAFREATGCTLSFAAPEPH